jgi:hypothetical protein
MWRRLLLALLVIVTLSALGGAAGLVGNGVGMDPGVLDGTPFDTFLWPGLLLGLVVGGTHLVAAVMVARRTAFAPLAALGAAFVLLVWIFTQVMVIDERFWLQWLYFVLPMLEVGCVTAWLGLFRSRAPGSDSSHEA